MVVDYLSMSSVNFAVPDFCSLIPNVPALPGNFPSTLHWKSHRAASCSSKMISFSNINKQYGKQLLFVDASFRLNPGEKVGLVGPNGAGKTTLFRMVVGEETPDEGSVAQFSPQRLKPNSKPGTQCGAEALLHPKKKHEAESFRDPLERDLGRCRPPASTQNQA